MGTKKQGSGEPGRVIARVVNGRQCDLLVTSSGLVLRWKPKEGSQENRKPTPVANLHDFVEYACCRREDGIVICVASRPNTQNPVLDRRFSTFSGFVHSGINMTFGGGTVRLESRHALP